MERGKVNFKTQFRKLKYIIKGFFDNDKRIKMYWDRGTNFGDAFNPYLIELLSERDVSWVDRRYYHKSYLMSIGSILQKANKNSIIWGSGLISEELTLKEEPKKICAVRGPRTRKRLLELGFNCPEIYGDPALLIPTVYSPSIEKKFKLGVIPHYVDKDSEYLNNLQLEDVLIIDIKNKNHFEFIDQVLSCEKIVSSSLHGIIIADAYKIPSIWIEFSDKVKGNGFKFFDYFESVNRKDTSSYLMNSNTKIEDLLDLFYDYKISIDIDKLIESFPYKKSS